MDELILSDIIIYPVKGLPGIRVNESICEQRGLQHDRRWVIADENGRFISQREFAVLTQFKINPVVAGFAIAHGGDEITLPQYITEGQRIPIRVWEDEVYALEADDAINKWFSEKLSKNCKLYFMDAQATRKADSDFAIHAEEVSFADGFPYLIIGETSLNQLNQKLDSPIPMDRFRPNMVFSGGYPHQEDDLKDFRIGDVSFYGVKPCSRCVVTTIDQSNGDKGKEPLITLASYRKFGSKIKFGMNILAKNDGIIRVGDAIEIG